MVMYIEKNKGVERHDVTGSSEGVLYGSIHRTMGVIQGEDWTWPRIEYVCKTSVSRDEGWDNFMAVEGRVGTKLVVDL